MPNFPKQHLPLVIKGVDCPSLPLPVEGLEKGGWYMGKYGTGTNLQ